jgi:ATPase subunit of ABC transporter with duplicated ATPase domains
MDAIEALAQGLNAFKGGVVLISHNQRLISLVCTEIWVVTPAGTVEQFNGDFEDYKEEVIEHMGFASKDDFGAQKRNKVT